MYKIVVLLLLAGAYSFNTYAEPQSAADDTHIDVLTINHQLSLDAVLAKTIARSPQQALLAAQKYAVSAKEKVADSYLPSAPAIAVSHQNDTIGSGRNERDWMVELELPLWLPKEKSASQQVAALSAENLEANQGRLQLLVAGALRESVWDVALNQNAVALFIEKLNSAEKLEAAIEKKYQAGELAKTDLMLVQQDTLLARKHIVDAKAELMHARFRYMQLTGLNEIPAQLDEVQSTATDYQQSPQWQSAEAKVALAQSERNLSATQRRDHPQLVLNARSSQGAFDTRYNQSVGVQFRLPFDTDARNAPRLAAAEQALGEAMAAREQLRYRLEAALHEAEHNLQVSTQALALAKEQLALAKNSTQLAEKAYHLGEIDLMRLLRIHTQTFEAEKSYTTREIELKRDIARYNQAVGVLP